MKFSMFGSKEDVQSVVNMLLTSSKDLPLIMIIHPGTSEDCCVQCVTDVSLDVIAKTKDLAF